MRHPQFRPITEASRVPLVSQPAASTSTLCRKPLLATEQATTGERITNLWRHERRPCPGATGQIRARAGGLQGGGEDTLMAARNDTKDTDQQDGRCWPQGSRGGGPRDERRG